jgi:hypothetical protein
MDNYTMSCFDPSRKRNIIPGAKAKSKLRYMYAELFNDFNYYLWGTFEFYLSITIYLLAFWLRIYIHYLFGYILLQIIGTPIYNFKTSVLQIQYKYMSESISLSNEVSVVFIGPAANLILFLCFILFGNVFGLVSFIIITIILIIDNDDDDDDDDDNNEHNYHPH